MKRKILTGIIAAFLTVAGINIGYRIYPKINPTIPRDILIDNKSSSALVIMSGGNRDWGYYLCRIHLIDNPQFQYSLNMNPERSDHFFNSKLELYEDLKKSLVGEK